MFKLYNKDCTEVMKCMDSESVDLILTDPPYNLGGFMRNRQTNLKKMRKNFFGDAGWDDLSYEEWKKELNEFFLQASRISKSRSSLIMFMSIIKVETVIKLAEKHGFYYKTTGIWHKTNPMPRNMNLHFINSIEAWIYFTYDSKTGTFNNDGKAIHDFIETSVSGQKEKKYLSHPTQKPERLFEHFMKILSNPKDVVFDPFMGSGTAGVVAKKLGRDFIGCEINETYFNAAQQRIAEVTEQLSFKDI